MKPHILNHHKLVAMIIQHEIRLPCVIWLSTGSRKADNAAWSRLSAIFQKTSPAWPSSSSYMGEQLHAKSPEFKKFKRCCVAVWRWPAYTKGKRCCSHHTAPQKQTEVSRQNMVVSRPSYKKKSPFQDKQMPRKNNQILSLCSFIFMWQQPFQTSRRLIFIIDWPHKRW